jgi:arsenate reductase-like glutaredoxin family protein
MIARFISNRFMAFALIALGCSAGLESALAAADETAAKETAASVAKEKAKKTTAAELQKALEQLNAQRDSVIAEHAELVRQLKDADDAQRKTILEKMEAQKKALQEAMNAVQSRVIDERRKQRAEAGKKR